MKSIFSILLVLVCLKSAYSQNVTVGPGEKPLRISMNKENVDGSPYFNEAYSESNIKTESKKELSLKLVRYNLYTQQLEYTDTDHAVYAIQDSVTSFSLVDSVKTKHSFVKGSDALGFVEVIFEGKLSLLKKYIVKKQVVEDFYTKKKTAKFIRQNLYYTSKGGAIQQFQRTNKGLIKALADKKAQIAAYLKMEQPDLDMDSGLIGVFKFYNSLD